MDGAINGKTIALLGLAFKAKTDDIRYSPAITAIEQLIQLGAHIHAYDPEAMKNMAHLFPTITYCSSADEALRDADALIIMTEWDEFKHLNIARMAELMRGNYIVDARNILNVETLRAHGFICDAIGQACLYEVHA